MGRSDLRESPVRPLRGRHVALICCLLGLTAGATLGWSTATAAATACTRPDLHFNVGAATNTGVHRGVKATNPGMAIYDHDIACVKVSSLFLFNSNTSQVEIGGYEDPHQLAVCTYPAGSGPALVRVIYFNNLHQCIAPYMIDPWRSTTFTIHNDNLDNTFAFDFDGSAAGTLTGDFSYGSAITNGERWGLQDSPHADFDGLRFQNSTGFHDWTNTGGFSDSDPNYKNQIHSDTHVEVVPG
jgi:hypothetical protein